jgi:hypothetical protein
MDDVSFVSLVALDMGKAKFWQESIDEPFQEWYLYASAAKRRIRVKIVRGKLLEKKG